MRNRRTVRASTRSLGNSLATPNGNQAYQPDAPREPVAPGEPTVKQDQLFKACFAHAAIGFSITDLDGRLLEVNPAYCAITGYAEAELRITEDFKTLTHPDDLAANIEQLNALKSGEIPAFTIEKRYLRKDGGIVWVRNSVSLIRDGEGQPTHFVRLTEDITAHKLSEATLSKVEARNEAILASAQSAQHAAERKYQQIFEDVGEGIFQSTPDGHYLAANPALAQIHGFDSPEELIASCRDISQEIYVDPARREEFKRLIEEHGKVLGFEHESWRKDGSKIWISVNARAVRDAAGEIAYYEGTTQNVTERKQAEQALRESEERYRDLVENSHEFVCTHDLNGIILSINRAALEGLGCAASDVVHKKSICDLLAPEFRDQFDEYMRRILKEGATRGKMVVLDRMDQRRVLEYYNWLRTDGVDAPLVRGIARDITEERRAQRAVQESEERYRELFENSKDAIYVHDMSGRYTSVNRAAERLSGYTRQELTGRHFSSLLTPEYARHVCEQLCKKLEASGETTYEVELITKQGRRIPVEVSSRLIIEDGLPVGVQGCVRDVSEKKRAHDAARSYSRRLIEAQEAERRRIAIELHDQVGQILTAVKMNLHALQKTCEAPDMLKSIQDNLSAIDEAVDQVRDLSVDLRPLLLDDFGLVVALRWYLDRQGKNSGAAAEFISLSLNEDDRFPAALETACFRIVQEGMTNIVRHASAKQVSIRLERTGSDLILLTADDGAGFDVKAVRSAVSGAATLGLRGMEERAQAVGGTLTIDSAPGLGTQVCASFPVAVEKPRVQRSTSAIDWVSV